MRTINRLLWPGLLAGCLPGHVAQAQHTLSLVAAGQVQLSSARFVGNAPPSARVGLVPWAYNVWAVGAAVGLSPRSAVQATVGYATYGLNIRAQPADASQASAPASLSQFEFQALEVALVARRYFPAPGRAGRWFAEAGADAWLSASGGASFSFGSYDPAGSGPGVAGSGGPTRNATWRPGLRAGLGREWRVSGRSSLALELAASLGLRDLDHYYLETVAWQQGRTIDPVYYTSDLATRASYVGLRAHYRWQLLGPR